MCVKPALNSCYVESNDEEKLNLINSLQVNAFNNLILNNRYRYRDKSFYIEKLYNNVEQFISLNCFNSDSMYVYKTLVENYYNNDIFQIYIDMDYILNINDNYPLYSNWKNYLISNDLI